MNRDINRDIRDSVRSAVHVLEQALSLESYRYEQIMSIMDGLFKGTDLPLTGSQFVDDPIRSLSTLMASYHAHKRRADDAEQKCENQEARVEAFAEEARDHRLRLEAAQADYNRLKGNFDAWMEKHKSLLAKNRRQQQEIEKLDRKVNRLIKKTERVTK